MQKVRYPAVAGMFYPDDVNELTQMLADFFGAAEKFANYSQPKAIIAPHAGYIYSGEIAASAYACLKNYRDKIKRVVVLAPAHRFAFCGIATISADIYATPFGNIDVDKMFVNMALSLPDVAIIDQAFDAEHALEVHLPFLQTVLNNSFSLVPLLVGDATAKQVASVLRALWDDQETLIVISSDLSHYQEYLIAKRLDQITAGVIEALKYEQINAEDACGYIGIQGLLMLAKEKQLLVKTIDLRNSGDTAGPKDQVVGYGAFHFYS